MTEELKDNDRLLVVSHDALTQDQVQRIARESAAGFATVIDGTKFDIYIIRGGGTVELSEPSGCPFKVGDIIRRTRPCLDNDRRQVTRVTDDSFSYTYGLATINARRYEWYHFELVERG